MSRSDPREWGRPDGLLFDMDGTLVDTEPLWFEAAQEAVARFGGHLPDAAAEALVGLHTPSIIDTLRTRFGAAVRPAALHAAVLDALAERLRRARAMPGAADLVAAAMAHGVRCAVVSNSSADVVRDTLAPHPWARDLTLRVSADDVRAAKPAPEIYLLALERLGLDAARCVAIEDSPTGAIAAVAAGVRCIGVAQSAAQATALHDVTPYVLGSLAAVGHWLDLLDGDGAQRPAPPTPRDGDPT